MALKKAAAPEVALEVVDVVEPVAPEVVIEAAEVVVATAPEVVVDVVEPVAPEVVIEAAEVVQPTESDEEQESEVQLEAAEPSILVMVENLTHDFFYQHSTGIRIGGREVKEMKADGWLENQINANLLKLA